jgi:hypothetical protein
MNLTGKAWELYRELMAAETGDLEYISRAAKRGTKEQIKAGKAKIFGLCMSMAHKGQTWCNAVAKTCSKAWGKLVDVYSALYNRGVCEIEKVKAGASDAAEMIMCMVACGNLRRMLTSWEYDFYCQNSDRLSKDRNAQFSAKQIAVIEKMYNKVSA